MYKIVRHFYTPGREGYRNRVIRTGLTLEEAQAHCKDPETASKTATSARVARYTAKRGPWFDGYEECKR